MEVASWFCYRELADNCKAVRTPVCSAFLSSTDTMPEKFSNSGHLLTFLRASECKGKENDFNEIAAKSPNEQGVIFVRAIEALDKNNIELAMSVLKPILFDENWDRAYKDEALRRLVSVVKTTKDLTDMADIWTQGDPTSWEWRTQGISLLREMIKRKYVEGALSVGRKLAKENGLPVDDKKKLVLFSFYNGDRKFAFNLVYHSDRMPSSEDSGEVEFQKVTQALLREFQ
jgi:hypothetical protein